MKAYWPSGCRYLSDKELKSFLREDWWARHVWLFNVLFILYSILLFGYIYAAFVFIPKVNDVLAVLICLFGCLLGIIWFLVIIMLDGEDILGHSHPIFYTLQDRGIVLTTETEVKRRNVTDNIININAKKIQLLLNETDND